MPVSEHVFPFSSLKLCLVYDCNLNRFSLYRLIKFMCIKAAHGVISLSVEIVKSRVKPHLISLSFSTLHLDTTMGVRIIIISIFWVHCEDKTAFRNSVLLTFSRNFGNVQKNCFLGYAAKTLPWVSEWKLSPDLEWSNLQLASNIKTKLLRSAIC